MPDAYISSYEPLPYPTDTDTLASSEGESLIICCEGNWQSDNGQLSYYDARTGTTTNGWFRAINKQKLGDTPSDILQINDTLIAIAVNWSNLIQFIHPDGTSCGTTEEVPNNRRLCTDGQFLYVTSYAHRCGKQSFEKGYVAKIDLSSKQVIATCQVGWEPEGIQYYRGRLYVANTGGYSFSEGHDYESTISIVDAETMQHIRLFDTGCPNLFGKMSQAGQYLCINSTGDYYGTPGCTIIYDCETDSIVTYPAPATYNASDGHCFYTLGTQYSYNEQGYSMVELQTIDPTTKSCTNEIYNDAVSNHLRRLKCPYELYISPHTGNIYFTDAKDYSSSGSLWGYTRDGQLILPEQHLYICPGHLIGLKRQK